MTKLSEELWELAKEWGVDIPGCWEEALVVSDLLWESDLTEEEWEGERAVIFETTHRVVALQRLRGEIRYYAGYQPRFYEERDAETFEMGVFPTLEDGLSFLREYLSGLSLEAVDACRKIKSRWENAFRIGS